MSITSLLEQAQVVHGLASLQVVTGALSALFCKGTFGRAVFGLFGFVILGKVDQSSVPKHLYRIFTSTKRVPIIVIYRTFIVCHNQFKKTLKLQASVHEQC